MTRVTFVGAGMLPVPVASDKAFLLQMAPLLREQGLDLRFLSIVESPPSATPADDSFSYLGRPGHADDLRYYTLSDEGRPIGYHHIHSPVRQTLELASTLLGNRGALKGEGGPAVYHWMDISTAIPALRAAVGSRAGIVASSPEWIPRGRANDVARARSYSFADVILTGTRAAARALRAAGCTAPLIAVVPWGSKGTASPLDTPVRQGPLELIWTGFIRQIQWPDFLLAHAVAESVTARNPDIRFTFCFKPQFFEDSLKEYESERIRLIAGDRDFVAKLVGYDAVFSPTVHTTSTMGPPLSWIDAFSAGLPVVTTATPGIEEILGDGRFGVAASGAEGLAERLCSPAIAEELRGMREGVRREFEQHYALHAVASRWADVYRWVAEGRQAGQPTPVEEAGR